MKVAVFSAKPYDRTFFQAANAQTGHELVFFEPRLTSQTCPLAAGFPAICAFVNDTLDSHVLLPLMKQGVRLIALRCAGFNHVDLEVADHLGLTVTRVPAYSPHAVAEHTLALILALDRKIHKAYNRVREGNFALDGLLGVELYGRTAGVVGTGKIGAIVARILWASAARCWPMTSIRKPGTGGGRRELCAAGTSSSASRTSSRCIVPCSRRRITSSMRTRWP